MLVSCLVGLLEEGDLMTDNKFDTDIKSSKYDKVGANIRYLEENDSELMRYLELV